MIAGIIGADGAPEIQISVGSRTWRAVLDTGFTGDLELPYALGPTLNARFYAHGEAQLAAGQRTQEDYYLVDFPFDGHTIRALASFVVGDEILIGTRLLRHHRLTIDFPAQSVHLERS